jgi:predicted MPP superfamily phosphohydrolase
MRALLALWLMGPLCQSGPVTRYPYVQRVTERGALIAWKADAPAELECAGRRWKARTGVEHPGIQWVELDGLISSTEYPYRLMAGVQALTSGDSFRTAPGPGDKGYRDFRFAVFGDAGFNRFEDGRWRYDATFEPDPSVNTQLAVARAIGKVSPDFLLTTGDNISDIGKEINYEPQMFCAYRELIRRVPIYPSLGNHDYYGGTQTKEPLGPEDENAQPFYRNMFPPPRAANGDPAGAYYSFDYGDAHFTALNTVRPNYVDYREGSAQMRWLEQDLRATRKRWKIVYMHYPVYSSTQTAPQSLPIRLAETKRYIEPLLVKYGVDLVLSGHTHSYQRSHPVNGVTYVVTGGGGRSADHIVPSREPWNAVTREGFHFVTVHVTDARLEVETVFLDGARDRFTIAKR